MSENVMFCFDCGRDVNKNIQSIIMVIIGAKFRLFFKLIFSLTFRKRISFKRLDSESIRKYLREIMIVVFGLLLEWRPFLRHFRLPFYPINERMPNMTRNIQEFLSWAVNIGLGWLHWFGKNVAFWFLLL